MGYLLGLIWCLVFGGFGLFLIYQRKKHAAYLSFIATVESVNTKGRNTAILDSGIEKIGKFRIQFQDIGDYYEGQSVECMWDGENPDTAQEDLRGNQIIGIVFCFSMVALMVVIIFVFSFVPLPDYITVE